MSINSDSEVEEVSSRPSLTPRVTRRPVPILPRRVSGSADNNSGANRTPYTNDSDSDGSDDASFFRLRQPAINTPIVESETNNNASFESSPNKSQPVGGSLDPSEGESSSSSDDGDDSVCEVVSVKRKYSDSETSLETSKRRARSVSLTPPPGDSAGKRQISVPVPAGAKMTAVCGQQQGSSGGDALLLDSDNETTPLNNQCSQKQDRAQIHQWDTGMQDLDPSLQAAMFNNDTSGVSLLERVQVEFQLVYDAEFLSIDVPAMWNPKRWARVKPGDQDKITKKLNNRIAVVVFSNDTVGRALQAFSDNFTIDVMATDPVLKHNSMRIFLTSKLSSLGNLPVFYVKVFPRSVFNRMMEKDHMARQRQDMELEQAERDLELVHRLRQNAGEASESVDTTDNADCGLAESASAPVGIRIKIRDSQGKDVLLMVAPTTTVQSIIDNYCKIAGLPAGTQVSLEFDDEKLNPKATVGETDIEDDDMLSASWK
ncbi:hypothetical protein LPJ66_002609 [Kickxella alabastrina]|uniref:Uncharacterized protein n=1 Tax=Kickxella alabastrina TaxID=61397 RepID=A0ACC1IPZ8_9FUNG|nr:hypothetical protein LPJ66_002609 [Kickxella alabastrina]